VIEQAVRQEILRELAWLQDYEVAFSKLNLELDLPQTDLSALIRIIQSNKGTLCANRGKQYCYLEKGARPNRGSGSPSARDAQA